MNQVSHEALEQIFLSARTAQNYLPEPVTPDHLREIWEVAKWGPTSVNSMPARIVWCLGQAARDRLADCASSSNGAKIRAAPAAAIVGMDLEFHEKLPEQARSWFAGDDRLIEETALRNSALQGAYLIIAARALGFGVGPMSGFDADAVDNAFFAGTKIRSNFIMTLGRADPQGFRPRGPRLGFEEATRIE